MLSVYLQHLTSTPILQSFIPWAPPLLISLSSIVIYTSLLVLHYYHILISLPLLLYLLSHSLCWFEETPNHSLNKHFSHQSHTLYSLYNVGLLFMYQLTKHLLRIWIVSSFPSQNRGCLPCKCDISGITAVWASIRFRRLGWAVDPGQIGISRMV